VKKLSNPKQAPRIQRWSGRGDTDHGLASAVGRDTTFRATANVSSTRIGRGTTLLMSSALTARLRNFAAGRSTGPRPFHPESRQYEADRGQEPQLFEMSSRRRDEDLRTPCRRPTASFNPATFRRRQGGLVSYIFSPKKTVHSTSRRAHPLVDDELAPRRLAYHGFSLHRACLSIISSYGRFGLSNVQ
jgi:hypothetical protein